MCTNKITSSLCCKRRRIAVEPASNATANPTPAAKSQPIAAPTAARAGAANRFASQLTNGPSNTIAPQPDLVVDPPAIPIAPATTDRATVRAAKGGSTVQLDAHGYNLESVRSERNQTRPADKSALPYGLFAFNVTDVAPGGIANQILAELTSTPLLKNAIFKWIGLADNLTLPENFDPLNQDQLFDFLLKFSGLTWDHVSDVLLQELGDGNVAALTEVAGWLQNTNDDSTSSPGSMLQLVNDLANKIPAISVSELRSKIIDEVTKPDGVLLTAITKAIPQLASKFVPGAGAMLAAVKGLQWLIDNRTQLQQLFNKLINEGADALTSFNSAQFQTVLVDGFRQALPVAMSFFAGQVGIGSLPRDVKKALAFVPRKVDEAVRNAIRNVAKNVLKGGTAGGRNDGLLNGTVPYEFQYKTKTYELFATKESANVFVKLAEKGANGKTIILRNESFLQSAQDEFGAVQGKANTLAGVKKPAANQPRAKPSVFKDFKTVQQAFPAVVIALADEVKAGKCVAVDGGCFAAGTKLWTPAGYRNVEELAEGDLVLSRDQFNPAGLIEPRPIEKVFRRFTEVVNVHVGGQVIRTTGEHPFYAYGKGWTAAVELTADDWILTATGDWKPVEEVFATGTLEVVYNLRVAEHHTYFVGDEAWGWSAWVHNAYIGKYSFVSSANPKGFQAHHIGQDAALQELANYSRDNAPAIQLYGGTRVPNSPHREATRVQTAENCTRRRSGATTMTIADEATIARLALQAARAATDQGGYPAITSEEIDLALAAFWDYVALIGATASTVIPIPAR